MRHCVNRRAPQILLTPLITQPKMPTWSSSPTAHPSIEKCRLLRYFGSSLRVGQHYLDFSTYVESRVSFDSTAWNRYCSTSVEIYLKWQTSKRKLEIPAIIIIPLLCSLRLKIWTFPGKSKCGRKEGSWWGWCGVYVVWTGGRAIIRAWDRPSYGVPPLGDGHLQSPHCQDWR